MIACAKGCHMGGEESPPQQQTSHSRSSATEHLSKSISLSSQSSLLSLPSLDLQQASSFHQCILTLSGHSSYVSALALGGSSLYSGSADGEIRSWRPGCSGSGHVVAVSRSAVKSLVVAGDRLFSAHQDHKIHVWQIAHKENHSYKLAATLPTAGDRLLSLLSPENYVEVRRHKKSTWVHHADAVSAAAVSRDGAFLYSASWDRTFKVWRTSDGRCLESVAKAHDDAINAVVVSGDGAVYTGSADTTVKVWRRRPGEKRHALAATLERHKAAVNALALSPDGSVLYSGGCDCSVVVWEGGGCMAAAGALKGHTKAVLCLASAAHTVCSGSADRSMRVWRRGGGGGYSCLAVLDGHRGPIKCLAAAPDQDDGADAGGGGFRTIYSGSLDCDIKVWRVQIPK